MMQIGFVNGKSHMATMAAAAAETFDVIRIEDFEGMASVVIDLFTVFLYQIFNRFLFLMLFVNRFNKFRYRIHQKIVIRTLEIYFLLAVPLVFQKQLAQ